MGSRAATQGMSEAHMSKDLSISVKGSSTSSCVQAWMVDGGCTALVRGAFGDWWTIPDSQVPASSQAL